MLPRKRIGVLTPSSNTVLEPMTTAILAGLPEVSVHFSRFRVTEIALSGSSAGQFELETILAAARLLADAKVDVIGWSGTSAGWLGFERDEALCQAITAETGIPATTSVLALNQLFRLHGVERFGLVTPYSDDVQQAIMANYERAGISCMAERHLGISVNFDFAAVTEERIAQMVREVAGARPQAITVFCTNMRGARLAQRCEAETGIPLYDTVSTVVWSALRIVGVDPSRVGSWGGLFRS
jgi:maleate isomerase